MQSPYSNPSVEHVICKRSDGYSASYNVGAGWVALPPQPTQAASIAAIEVATRNNDL